jgi:hypothetical protein
LTPSFPPAALLQVIDKGFDGLSLKADIYAFAIIIWECLTKKVPWEGKTDAQIIKAMLKGERPEVDDSMDPALRKLMEECWSEVSFSRERVRFLLK